MRASILSFVDDDSGATAIEYGLIAALISVVILGTLQSLGANMNAKFTTIGAALTPATTTTTP